MEIGWYYIKDFEPTSDPRKMLGSFAPRLEIARKLLAAGHRVTVFGSKKPDCGGGFEFVSHSDFYDGRVPKLDSLFVELADAGWGEVQRSSTAVAQLWKAGRVSPDMTTLWDLDSVPGKFLEATAPYGCDSLRAWFAEPSRHRFCRRQVFLSYPYVVERELPVVPLCERVAAAAFIGNDNSKSSAMSRLLSGRAPTRVFGKFSVDSIAAHIGRGVTAEFCGPVAPTEVRRTYSEHALALYLTKKRYAEVSSFDYRAVEAAEAGTLMAFDLDFSSRDRTLWTPHSWLMVGNGDDLGYCLDRVRSMSDAEYDAAVMVQRALVAENSSTVDDFCSVMVSGPAEFSKTERGKTTW